MTTSKPYNRSTYYWRPGFRGPRRVDVALLRTCKRVWLETRPLPFEQLEMTFFVACSDRRPPGYMNDGPHQHLRCRRFTPNQWQALDRIHILLQGLTPENVGGFFNTQYLLRPSTVTYITRYTDWFWWEQRNPLMLDGATMQRCCLPETVTKVVMEFEMIQSRELELKTFIDGVFRNEDAHYWRRMDKRVLKNVKEWSWEGPTTFGDRKTFPHHPPGPTMTYVVKVLTW
ncbi:hypothetical protein K469DRAFT_780097, partial [Zopfia rhizophila CBS 207.26]